MLRIAMTLTLAAIALGATGCAPKASEAKSVRTAEDESMADLALLAASVAQSWQSDDWIDVTTRTVPLTEGFQSDSTFQFTISPDDRWLVYFREFDSRTEPELDIRYGKMQVVDLVAQRAFSFDLREYDVPGAIFRGDASWTPDSSYCIFDPPLRQGDSMNLHTAALIDVRNEQTPRVVKAQVKWGAEPAVTSDGEEFEVPAWYGCSDCFEHTNDAALMAQHIDPEHLRLNNHRGSENDWGNQIVAPDGTRIYFQKRLRKDPDLDEVVICEFNVQTGTERPLKVHRGLDPHVQAMRISPDGTRLAYQLSSGLYVLDVASGRSQKVANKAYYAMHWSSDSARLYFYRGQRNPSLSVAEFAAKSPAASTAPSQR